MVIPALIKNQSLPSFVTSKNLGRLFIRLLSNNSNPAYTMENILGMLNKMWKSLKSYYIKPSVTLHSMTIIEVL
ncbi:Myosin type-2 heavy chain 1 [Thecaphora frezii]